MSRCAACAAELTPGSRFCSSCGAVVVTPTDPGPPAVPPPPSGAPHATPPPPPSPPPTRPDERAPVALPHWLVSDWPLVVICSLALVLGLALGGAVIGLVAAVAANGFAPEGYVGAVAGVYLAFAGLGADTQVIAQADDGGVIWLFGAVSPVALLGAGLLARSLLRAASTRMRADIATRRAFVAKFAVVAAVLLAIAGSAAAIGEFDEGTSGPGMEVVADVGVGEAAWWLIAVVVVAGAWQFERRAHRWHGVLRALLVGTAAATVAIILLGLSATVVGVIAADRGDERLAAAALAPFAVGNAGSVAHSVAVGASAGTGFDDVESHLSLFNWELPPGEEDSSTPPWMWLLALVPPLIAAAATWRHLNRSQATSSQDVLGSAFLVACGYAVVSWLAALFMPLVALAGAIDTNLDAFGRSAVARPSVVATLGLAALSSLIGAMVAGALWARGAGVPLVAQVHAAAPPPPPPPPQVHEPPRACASCGHDVPGGATFCPTCGHSQVVSV